MIISLQFFINIAYMSMSYMTQHIRVNRVILHLFYLEYCTAAIITNLTSTVLLFSLSNISKASVILLWISAMRESVNKHTKYTCRYNEKCLKQYSWKKKCWLLQFRIDVTCNYTILLYFSFILGCLNHYPIEKIGLS